MKILKDKLAYKIASILQYTMKSKETRIENINFEFKKGVGIAIKSKETSS